MKSTLIILSILFISTTSFNLRASKQSYDSYVLAVQWANGYCSANNCGGRESVVEKNTMTIHGLWPSLKSGKYLDDCTSGVTIKDTGSALFLKMRKYWPSFTGANTDFWYHEYNKHGYCMVEEYDWDGYEDYFDFVIDLFENKYKYLIKNAYSGYSNKNVTVTYTELQTKIRKIIPNATFKVNCKSKFLYEIYFYLEKDDFSPSTDSRFSNVCASATLVFK